MTVTARVVLLVGFFLVVTVVALELAFRRHISRLVPDRQFRFRVYMAVLLLAEIGLILAGTVWLSDQPPLLQIAYWTGCLVLAFILIIAVIIDVRSVLINYLVERRDLFRDRDDRDI